jgi:hypothetical protein
LDDITIIDTSIAKKQAEVREAHERAEALEKQRIADQTLRMEKVQEHNAREAFERADTATLRTKPPQDMERPERAQSAPAGDSIELGRVHKAQDFISRATGKRAEIISGLKQDDSKSVLTRDEQKKEANSKRTERENISGGNKLLSREMIERVDKKAEVEKKLLGSIEKKDEKQKEMLKSSRGLAGKEKPVPLVGSPKVKATEKVSNKNLQKDKSGRSSRKRPDRGR